MKIMNPGIYFYADEFDTKKIKRLERAARLCYKSESGNKSPEEFIADKCKIGHESVIEHEKITIYIVCDRGVSHEIVRHRMASYSQESTRYCNYGGDKFSNQVTFINIPVEFFDNMDQCKIWYDSCLTSERNYLSLIDSGVKPQIARSALNNSTKTEIAVTYNMREWRHFFKLRTAPGAHPQMRQIAIAALKVFQKELPALFSDIEYDEKFTADDQVWVYAARDDESLDKFLKEFVNGDLSSIV